MNDKKFGKTNVKLEIRIYQCTPVSNFSEFGELQLFGPNFPKKKHFPGILGQTQHEHDSF